MRVQVHTKFCFLCVLTFLFHQGNHCHEQGHSHQHGGHDDSHSDIQISQAPYVRGASLAPESSSPQGPSLEEEQHFYIQQLFNRYGQKGRLDFHGFQSLLFSLGLGEVKVVDVDHDELGHDHVSHMGALGGMHTHSSVNEGQGGHGHGHGHGHSHSHSHHDQSTRSPHTDQDPKQCNQQTTADAPVAGRPAGHDHDHNHHHHDHDHNHSHHHDHDHDTEHNHNHTKAEDYGLKRDNGHVQATDDKKHKHELTQVQPKPKNIATEHQNPHNHSSLEDGDHQHGNEDHQQDHGDHQHGNEDHHRDHQHGDRPDHNDHHHGDHNQNDIQGGQTDKPPSTPSTTSSQPKRPKNPAQSRRQRRRSKITPLPSTSGDRDHQHSHNQHGNTHRNIRKEKREISGRPVAPTLPAAVLPLHPGELAHHHEECLNLTQLLHYYGLNPDSPISPSQFTYLCPALLYQIDSRVCIQHHHQTDKQETLESVSPVWVWLWGFVSITIISLLSLVGVVLVPFLKQSCFKFLLTFLVALAVGTLSGDALLHLLPHSQENHDHSEHGHSHNIHDKAAFDGVWKGLMALAGIYLLFIIEHCIGMFKHYKDHRVTNKAKEEGKIGRKLSDHKLNRRSDAEWLHLKPLSGDPENCTTSCDNSHNDTQLTEVQTPESPANKMPLAASYSHASPTQKSEQKAKLHGHSHGGNCHSDQEMKDAGIASIAWMVIMGDGMHNFSDGLAIGAAFSANLTGGISTSVAVFCHELPHELGDFAVLLKAGMSVKQAIVYNLLSALMAYVGMLIGTAVGQYTENVTSWIFAITAGMFLYVALVDMLPEMLHGDSEDHKRCQLGHFILQNLGMVTGFAIMLLIAIFEDQIVFDFGF